MIEYYVNKRYEAPGEYYYYPEFQKDNKIFSLNVKFYNKKLIDIFIEYLNIGLVFENEYTVKFERNVVDNYDLVSLDRMAYEAG